jgi:hypothetical protein
MVNRSKIKGSAYEAKIRDLLTAELKIEFKRMPLKWFNRIFKRGSLDSF